MLKICHDEKKLKTKQYKSSDSTKLSLQSGLVYIIYSDKIDRYYTGVTDDLDWRLERHNAG